MILEHGTTRHRAERIAANGPDPNYREPVALPSRQGDGFSTLRQWFPADVVGDPEDYARGKAAQFPDEGGPVVLRLDVPDEVVTATDTVIYPPEHGLVVFDAGYGLEELLAAWPRVKATIRDVT